MSSVGRIVLLSLSLLFSIAFSPSSLALQETSPDTALDARLGAERASFEER